MSLQGVYNISVRYRESERSKAMQKKIYLIWDRKEHCVYKATTNRTKAYEEVERLNATEFLDRYVVKQMDDFVNKY